MTTKEIFEKVERKLFEKSDQLDDIRGVYKFELAGPQGGTWIVDLREDTLGVREAEEEAQCTFKGSDENFINLFTGKLKPERALLTGKIKMSGDIGLAMKLGQLLRK
ncbi:MAG: SCP2 sterol-binding domain-containing protein [Thermodesulfobacteriota bacterium]